MNSLREKNLLALKLHRPALYHAAISQPSPSMADCRPEGLACHDAAPEPETERHLALVPGNGKGLAVFLGMGKGESPLTILKERPQVEQLAILEPSLAWFRQALEFMDLTPLFANSKVEWFVGPTDWENFERKIYNVVTSEDTYLLENQSTLRRNPPVYNALRQQAYSLLNQLNISGATTMRFGDTFIHNRLANLALARRSRNLEDLAGCFAGIPAILVSSGPSLSQSIEALQQAKGRCLLIAVDGALAPLLKAGIMPDFITALDINEFSLEKLVPFLKGRWPFHLVCNYKASPSIPERLQAATVFFAKEDDPASAWIDEATGATINTPPLSSVAHLSLAVALITGAEPIIFVGQDLAYPKEKSQHAAGVINAREAGEKELIPTTGLSGELISTDRSLIEIRSRLEEVIAQYQRTFINASAAGMPIKGAQIMPLTEALSRYCRVKADINGPFAAALARSGHHDMGRLSAILTSTIASIDQAERLIRETGKIVKSIQQKIRAARIKGEVRRFDALPPKINDLLTKFNRINKQVDGMGFLWEQLSEYTFPYNRESDRMKEANARFRQEHKLLAWLSGEMERIAMVYRVRQEALDKYRPLITALSVFMHKETSLLELPPKKRGAAWLRELIQLYVQAGHYAAARDLLEDAPIPTELPQNDPDLLFLQGTIALHQFDDDTANDLFQRAANLSPDLAEKIPLAKERFARQWLDQLKKYGRKRTAYCHKWLDRIQVNTSPESSVRAELEALWQSDALEIGQLLKDGVSQDAKKLLDSWAPYAGGTIPWLQLAIRRLLDSGHLDEALAMVERMLSSFPDSAEALGSISRFRFELGQFDEGIASLRKAVSLDPAQAVLWDELGDLLFSGGDHANALSCYRECHAALPERTILLKKVGDCLMGSGLTAEAKTAYEAYAALTAASNSA